MLHRPRHSHLVIPQKTSNLMRTARKRPFQKAGGGGNPPPALSVNLLVDLDAEFYEGDPAAVTAMFDQSGNNNHARRNNDVAGANAEVSVGTFNGQPAFLFPVGNRHPQWKLDNPIPMENIGSIVFVWAPWDEAADAPGGWARFMDDGGAVTNAYWSLNNVNEFVPTPNTTVYWDGVLEAGNIVVPHAYGVMELSTTFAPAGATIEYVFDRFSATPRPIYGSVSRVLVYDGQFTAQDRTDLGAHLKAKYGTP